MPNTSLELAESELVSRALHDDEAFSILYERCYDKIYGYILRRCSNEALAQDLTSETFLKGFKSLASYKPRPDKPFIAWLYRIAANEINMYFRKQKKYQFVELDQFPHLANHQEEHEIRIEQETELETYHLLQQAMLLLSADDQEMLSLRYFEKKEFEEIAQIIGTKEVSVRSRMSRATTRLRKLLQQSHNEGII